MAEARQQPRIQPQPEAVAASTAVGDPGDVSAPNGPSVASRLGIGPLVGRIPSQSQANVKPQAETRVQDGDQADPLQQRQQHEAKVQPPSKAEDVRHVQDLPSIERIKVNEVPTGSWTAEATTYTPPTSISTSFNSAPTIPIPYNTANGTPVDRSRPREPSPLPPPPPPPPIVMSNPPRPPGPQIPPESYPSPTYAPPGEIPTQYGYASSGQSADAYRGGTAVGNNSMSLPSMRTFDPLQQQQPPPPAQQSLMPSLGAQVPPVAVSLPYYSQPMPIAGSQLYGPPDAFPPRYALPPTISPLSRAVLAVDRHKKEIKRRTKTGCLTCRKRRIKCDEQHPVCRNCQKSKRDCLGYDPIFKQQQNPTNIQPAPDHRSPSVPSNGSLPPAPLPPSAAAYTNPSLGFPNTSGTPGTMTPPNALQGAQPGRPEYAPAIDPALDNVATTSTSTSHFPAMKPMGLRPLDERTSNVPHLRGGAFVPVSMHSSALPSSSLCQKGAPTYTNSPAKNMQVEELVALGGATGSTRDSPTSTETLEEVKRVYNDIYAPALAHFFECKWFAKEGAVKALTSDRAIVGFAAGFLDKARHIDSNDSVAMSSSGNLEFRVVWDMVCLAMTAESKVNVGPDLPAEDDAIDAQNRVVALRALLAGGHVDQNPLLPPPTQGNPHRLREYSFWHTLGEFLRVKDVSDAARISQREQALQRMRTLLDGRENRDLLYSIAVIRALTPEFPPDFETTLPPHLDETKPISRLAVARSFVQNEASVTGGTTNVVRRIAGLAVRAFIDPGVNIQRRSG